MWRPHSLTMLVLGRVFSDRPPSLHSWENRGPERWSHLSMVNQPLCGRDQARSFYSIPPLWGLTRPQESWQSIMSFYKPETHKEVTEKEMEPSGCVYTVRISKSSAWIWKLKGISGHLVALIKMWFQMLGKLHNKSGSETKSKTIWYGFYLDGRRLDATILGLEDQLTSLN